MIESKCDMDSFCRDKTTDLLDPVHRHLDGFWYFCDETWADCWGPHKTRQAAHESCVEYGKQL